MIEFFTVPPGEDDAFRAAWTDAAAPATTLHRALRDDTQPRFAALSAPGGPDAGVLLLVEFDGDDALWPPVFARWTPRQGFIEARLDGGVAAVHWSSPLMYQRAVQAEGDLVAALPFPTRAALYARA
ncbi:hypothetical protein OM076_18165 [Solirubrobacter ginsenosidimutans]|uniref:Uncharacterized protein n=1 Tax=Solirubrobacter ginsenosidimutans TaxID=490573 RepID=A0A9X3MZA3_9ACTN|nr:hypothetical protein [Solirubrobacter ginsenosidimutans]MDA0162203.1 hypothetical protein [Solirubrobacter ginsenosidimutans]